MKINNKWLRLLIKSKFWFTLAIFAVWLTLFDTNNLLKRFTDIKRLEQLENDKRYLQEKIETDKQRLQELKTNNDNLEKFAREQYYMHKPNEDVYVIVEEDESE